MVTKPKEKKLERGVKELSVDLGRLEVEVTNLVDNLDYWTYRIQELEEQVEMLREELEALRRYCNQLHQVGYPNY
jgi:chromosome segregation ATPase